MNQQALRTVALASWTLFVVAALGAVAASEQTEPRASQATPLPKGDASKGNAIYAKSACAQCHGNEAQGTSAGPQLVQKLRPFGDFVAYVRKPTGTMPAQDVSVISDADLIDVYAFLQMRSTSTPTGQSQGGGGAALAGNAETGKTLFLKVGCFQCHSNEGQGGAQGPRIGPRPIPFERFVSYIRQPSGEMPPYTAKVMSEQELTDVYAFLQARPEPPAVSTLPQLIK